MNQYVLLLRRRNFVLLTLADAISVFGDQIGWVALLWFVMETAGRTADMGLLALGFGLPSVLLGPFVGHVLDKWSQKKVLMAANVLLGMIFTAIPVLYGVHRLSLVLLLILVVIAGCLTPFTTVGWMVMMPSVVEEEQLLGAANSLSETLWQTASLAGPLLGGILIARVGAPVAVFLDGCSFFVAAICLFRVQSSQSKRDNESVQGEFLVEKRSFGAEVWAGFKYLYGNKVVWWITLGALFLNMAFGQLEVSLPLFVHKELMTSAVVLGSLWTVYFLCSIGGAFASGVVRSRVQQGTLMAMMVMGWGLSFLPMIAFPVLWVGYLTLALAGFLFAGYAPMARTVVQRLVPAEYQGRVFGVRMSIIGIGMPTGSFLSGLVGQWVQPAMVIGLTGAAIALFGCVLMTIHDFRRTN